jgi:hypothetical protein
MPNDECPTNDEGMTNAERRMPKWYPEESLGIRHFTFGIPSSLVGHSSFGIFRPVAC